MAPTTFMGLNDDVLRMICAAAALSHPPHWDHVQNDGRHRQLRIEEGPITYCLGWLYLSHTSRRLRQICLRSPTLWANIVLAIPSASPSVTSTLLSRAQQAPLNLTTHSPNPESPWNRLINCLTHEEYLHKVALIEEHLDRAAVCKHSSYAVQYDIDWRPVFANRPLHALRFLSLMQSTPSTSQKLITITAPNLVELSIGESVFPVVTSPMIALRRLYIRLDMARADFMGSHNGDPILDLLRRTPQLERLTLTIDSRNFFREYVYPKDAEDVKLSHLQHTDIEIKGPFGKQFVWSRVEVPQTANVAFCIINEEADNPDPAIAMHLVRSQMRCSSNQILTLRKTSYSLEIGVRPPDRDPMEGAYLFWGPFSQILARDALNALPQLIVASNIVHILLDEFILEGGTELSVFLRGLPNVTTLTVETRYDTPSDANYTHPLESLTPSLLPLLHTLELVHYSRTKDTLPYIDAYRKYWDTVTEVSRSRSAAGNPVQVVKLSGRRHLDEDKEAGIEAECLQMVSAYVQNIVDTRPLR